FTPARAGDCAGSSIQGFTDALFPFRVAHDDGGTDRDRGVIARLGDTDLTWTQDAMSGGLSSGFDPGELKRNNFPIEQSNHPANRAHEAFGFPGAPIHSFGPIDSGDFFK